MLCVGDVAHELGLSLLFDEADACGDAALWQPALLSKAKDGSLVVLDQHDVSEFPTPSNDEVSEYEYVYHSTECARKDLHRLEGMMSTYPSKHILLLTYYPDTCVKTSGLPQARRDPRYIAVGKKSTDERCLSFTTRVSSLKRRSGSSSRTSSLSSTRADSPDIEIPLIVDPSRARSKAACFREYVWGLSDRGCAITREGNLGGRPCPGVEAAHIVP